MSDSREVAVRSTEEQLIEAAKAEFAVDMTDMVVPRLKIAQSLTREVKAGDAEEGDLVHSLTGEVYGTSVQLVVVQAFKARQWKNTEGNLRNTGPGEVEVPWDDNPCFGQRFADCPEAEETFRAAVRANQRDWGRGPAISTTYNFVGLILNEDGELEDFPVRLSLLRSAAKEGRNWITMLNIARAPWDSVYEISTREAHSKRGEPYTAVRVKQVRRTTDEEKAVAVHVAQLVLNNSVSYEASDDEDGGPARPQEEPATGGLEVG